MERENKQIRISAHRLQEIIEKITEIFLFYQNKEISQSVDIQMLLALFLCVFFT